MQPQWLVAIEAALIFGGVLGFGIWQLVSLKREKKKDEEKRARGEEAGRNRFRDG